MIVLGTVLVTLLTVWAAWAVISFTNKSVHFSKLSDRVVDQTRTEITFQVTMPPGRRAVCTIRALNLGKTQVGVLDTTVGPSATKTFTATAQVPTMEQAAGVEVKACMLA
jgi:hypothetical protein